LQEIKGDHITKKKKRGRKRLSLRLISLRGIAASKRAEVVPAMGDFIRKAQKERDARSEANFNKI